MALVNKTFSVNVTPGAMPPTVHVSEYDVGRAYTVSILDEQGNTFTIPTGTSASIEGTLNGAVGFTQSATVSNNQVSFTLSESMTAYSGKAWCKIKLTLNNQPIQTCAFVLAVDRAGVEAGTVIGAPGFEEQIVNAVNDWLDEHPPSGGGGLSDDVKQALLDCFENVAWINDQGQTYYDALHAALFPPADVVSISAVFTQGGAAIYANDSLDTLRQYLVVTATMSDSTTRTVTSYTLSGTLAEGTSTITVSYSGKTTTFTCTVQSSPPSDMDSWTDGVKYTDLTIVENTYINGASGETAYNGWNATGFVPIDGAARLFLPTLNGNTSTVSSKNNYWYTAEKTLISSFYSGDTSGAMLTVPSNAAFFRLSGKADSLASCIAEGIVPYAD